MKDSSHPEKYQLNNPDIYSLRSVQDRDLARDVFSKTNQKFITGINENNLKQNK